MSNRTWVLLRSVLPILLVVILAASCSGGGGSSGGGAGEGGGQLSEAENNLPAPPEGKATIGGTLTVNGQPREGEDVSLDLGTAPESSSGATGASGATGPTGPSVKTAADGTFVFEGVDPGNYSVSVGVLVEGPYVSADAFGLAFDDPCHAEGFQVLNGFVSDKTTGEPVGVIAAASNQLTSTNADQVAPIEVAAGDRVVVDIALVCSSPT